jgi:hypothetical protein
LFQVVFLPLLSLYYYSRIVVADYLLLSSSSIIVAHLLLRPGPLFLFPILASAAATVAVLTSAGVGES